MTRHTIIDVEDDGIESLQEKVDRLQSEMDDIAEEANDEYETWADVPESLEQSYDRAQTQVDNVRGRLRALEEAVDRWDGTEFEVSELTGGQLAAIGDEVATQTDGPAGDVKGGYKVELLRYAVESTPDGAQPDPAELQWQVMEWLFERVNEFNTLGEADTGFTDSSLKEQVEAE